MLSALVLASALSISTAQTRASAPIDVSALTVGAPTAIAELDLGKLKGDRAAPGIGSLMIDVDQKSEKVKIGTGSGRPGATASGLGDIGVDIEKTSEGQHENVIRLMLLGEAIGEFVNETPIPGLTFSWGPSLSGAIAYTDRDGRLLLLDQQKHKHAVSAAKDALLPAWATDGSRLAWAQKSGRKKYTLVWATIGRG